MPLHDSFALSVASDHLEEAAKFGTDDGMRTADLLGEVGVDPVSTSGMGDAILAKLDASV